MRRRRTRRATAIVVAGLILTGTLAGAARATSLLELTRDRRARLNEAVDRTRAAQRRTTADLRHQWNRTNLLLENGLGKVSGNQPRRWRATRRLLLAERQEIARRIDTIERLSERRLRDLQRRRDLATAWIEQWGVLETCPVRGPVSIADNFGVMVRKPGVPVHVHQGNDMMASTGTLIVAPFAGTAVAVPNQLGGMAVKVYGDRGYVYNAHLSAYGRLGAVNRGAVIGYVGSTGDAGGPHDHFEWHPGNGAAVDPNPFLRISCG